LREEGEGSVVALQAPRLGPRAIFPESQEQSGKREKGGQVSEPLKGGIEGLITGLEQGGQGWRKGGVSKGERKPYTKENLLPQLPK